MRLVWISPTGVGVVACERSATAAAADDRVALLARFARKACAAAVLAAVDADAADARSACVRPVSVCMFSDLCWLTGVAAEAALRLFLNIVAQLGLGRQDAALEFRKVNVWRTPWEQTGDAESQSQQAARCRRRMEAMEVLLELTLSTSGLLLLCDNDKCVTEGASSALVSWRLVGNGIAG